jgi:hypothetical protein
MSRTGGRHDIPVAGLPRAAARPCPETPGEPAGDRPRLILPVPAGRSRPGRRWVRKRTRAHLRTGVCPAGHGLSHPLSTGCPGPFHAQPPVQPDLRRRPPQPFARRVGLGAAGCWHPPARRFSEPDEPVGPASEPGAGLSSNLPLFQAMSTANLSIHVTQSEYLTTLCRGSAKYSLAPSVTSAREQHHFPRGRKNPRPLLSLRAAYSGYASPTWRHEAVSALSVMAHAADAALSARR